MEKRCRCFYCTKEIDKKIDHYVQLSTHNREKSPDDYAFFHFNCFTDYFNQRVLNKARATVQGMQSKALGLFNSPMIKNALAGSQAGEMLGDMLNKDLSEKQSYIIPKSRVEKQIKNDRKKRSNKKRKNTLQKV